MEWFDSWGKPNRAFYNEYGPDAYAKWRQTRIPMRDFERLWRDEHRLLPPGSPVSDEIERERPNDH